MRVTKTNNPEVKYYILSNGFGIVVGGHITLSNLNGKACFKFVGLGDVGARLVLNVGEKSYYRTIVDGKAELPVSYFDGKINLAVTTTAPDRKIYACEPLFAVKTETELLLLVHDIDAVKKSREAIVLCDDLTKRLAKHGEKTEEISSRLAELMEYWDVI